METTKIYLDIPNEIHLAVRKIQLDRQMAGEKINLRDLYIEILKKAVEK